MGRRKTKPKLAVVVPKLRHIYAYFWPQIRPYTRTIATSLLALIASVFFRLLEPWPLKVFLDNVLALDANASGGWLGQLPKERLLILVAISIVIVVACRAGSDYLSRVGFFVVGNKVVIRVRDRLYRHLQRLSLDFHTRSRSGDLIVRVTRDVNLLRDVTATAMLPLIASNAILGGMLLVMLWLNWKLTFVALAAVPMFWLTTIRLGKRIRESARRQRAREGAMATTASEALGAISVIKSMGLEDKFAMAFSQQNSSSQKEDLKASRMSVRLGRTIDVLLACATALVIWIGGNMALKGQMTAGEVVVFLTYLKRSFKPAQEFAKYTARLAKAAAAGERVIEILEQQPTIRDASDAQPAPRFRGHIELNDVVFGFHPEHPILAGVNLTIAASQRVALVGPSGGGKTTLLNHVLRLIDPTSGSVTIDGLDLRSVTLESMRSQTTSVMQDALLLADTIHENIVCARPDASRAEVIEAAKLANAHQFIMQTPGGYDSLVGERGSTLSRGQRQRIAIARAAIRRAPILVLDEPTVGLDEDSESIVTEALGRLSVDRTTLLVTHNMSLAAQSDVIAFLDHGQVVEFGPHEMLLRQSGRYAQWFTDQIRRTQGTSDEATR